MTASLSEGVQRGCILLEKELEKRSAHLVRPWAEGGRGGGGGGGYHRNGHEQSYVRPSP